MDLERARGRWLRRRLSVVLPAFLGSLAVVVSLALPWEVSPLRRSALLTVGTLLAASSGWLLFQVLACARLHRCGRRRDASLLRRTLLPSEWTVVLVLFLATLVGVLPFDLEVARRPFPAVAARPAPPREPGGSALEPILEEASAPETAAPRLEIPARLADFHDAPTPGVPQAAELAEAVPGQDDNRDFALRHDDFYRVLALPVVLTLERLGLPEAGDPHAKLPVETRLDGLLLATEHGDEGAGIALLIDVPTGPDGAIRAGLLFADFGGKFGSLDRDAKELTFERTTLEYVWRLAGHTRRAPFDLALSAGLSVDVVRGEVLLDPEDRIRLAPLVGIDVGFWQAGSIGLLLHASQSLPVNLTSGSSAVTDLSAMIRLDLTESISIHGGWRWVSLRMRDYHSALTGEARGAGAHVELSGPLAGIEIRF